MEEEADRSGSAPMSAALAQSDAEPSDPLNDDATRMAMVYAKRWCEEQALAHRKLDDGAAENWQAQADYYDRLLDRPGEAASADAEPIRAFAKAVLHGDDEHKAWLLEAAESFIASNLLPAPRGKGAQPPRPDASAGPNYVPVGGAGNGA